MKYNAYIKLLGAFFLAVGFTKVGYTQESASFAPAISRAVFKASQEHRLKSAVVDLEFLWSKKVYLSDMVSRRRTGWKDTLIEVKQENTRCRGVLVEGTQRVLTPAVCAKAPAGFSLQSVRLRFANGSQGTGNQNSVSVKGDFAEILVSKKLTAGITGVSLAEVPEGQTLAETFGSGILDELLQFFVSRGVVSRRANRITGVKNTLQVGDPFFYNGELVALVREVPAQLPVSFWGGVSEKGLALLRAQHKKELFAER